MIHRFIFSFLVAMFPVFSVATHVAVLETLADRTDLMTSSERRYLTNILREQAVKILSSEQKFIVMTTENINMMLPPGTVIEDCEGTCLVETGRNIAADYVAQARIGYFGSSLTINVELYETASGKLVDSFNGRGEKVEQLEQVIVEKSAEFFRKILNSQVELTSSSEIVESTQISDTLQVESETTRNEASEVQSVKISNENKKKNETAVPVIIESSWSPAKKKVWGGFFIGVTYNDFYGTNFGLFNSSPSKDCSFEIENAEGLLGNYWGIGVNGGLGGLFLFSSRFGLRANAVFSYRRGSGKSVAIVRLFWNENVPRIEKNEESILLYGDSDSRIPEKSDVEIEFNESQLNIDVPLAFRMMLIRNYYVEAGPMVSFNLFSKTESVVKDQYGSQSFKKENGLNLFEIDALFGVGMARLIRSFIVDVNLRFVLGVTPLNDGNDSPRTWQGQFNIAFWFI